MKGKSVLKLVGVLVCLYLFSSIYRNLKTPVVTTISVEPYTIVDKVEGEAKMDYQESFNTYALEDLVVEKVFVQKEQEVKKDAPLFQVNLSVLDEKISSIEQEMTKLTLQKENLVEQQAQKETDYVNQRAAADLDYQQTVQTLKQEQTSAEDESKKQEIALKIEQTTQMYQQKLAQILAPLADPMVETTELDIQKTKQTLEKYLEVQRRQGKILAPEAGSIQAVKINVGDRTSGQLAISIRDKHSLKELKITLEQDENKVKIGQEVQLTVQMKGGGKRTFSDFKVQDIATEESGKKVVTVLDSDNQLSVAESIQAQIIVSEKKVQRSLPVSVVYEDNQGKYVLIAEKKKTILGEKMVAKRKNIEVSEVFQNIVVLENENVDKDKIVDSAEKQINEGDVVRVVEK